MIIFGETYVKYQYPVVLPPSPGKRYVLQHTAQRGALPGYRPDTALTSECFSMTSSTTTGIYGVVHGRRPAAAKPSTRAVSRQTLRASIRRNPL